MEDIVLKLTEPVPSKIHFCFDGKDYLTISKDGLKFNHEDFPEWKPNDFAQAFIDILEKKFDIRFIKKELNG